MTPVCDNYWEYRFSLPKTKFSFNNLFSMSLIEHFLRQSFVLFLLGLHVYQVSCLKVQNFTHATAKPHGLLKSITKCPSPKRFGRFHDDISIPQ